jgi:hypothetical protein
MSLSVIEQSIRAFLGLFLVSSISFEDCKKSFFGFIELLPRLSHPIDQDDVIFSNILQRIRGFLAVEFTIQQITGKTETFVKTSFGNMLQQLSEKHYHTSDDGKYTCKYHPESLITHLFSAMTFSYVNVPEDYTEQEKFVCCITALLHDIGKVSCAGIVTIEHEKQYFTKFPFHGEMGSMILQRAYNNNFSEFLSKTEYETMCRAVCVHMCGYHNTDATDEQTQYKWNLLALEVNDVKRILHPLSLADTYAAYGNSEDDIQKIVDSRYSFVNTIMQNITLSLTFLSNLLIGGAIIQIKGTSGSGKSTLVSQLVSFFGSDKVMVIDRDDVMTRVVADSQNETYLGKASGELYARFQGIYIDNKLGTQVNAKMTQMITEGISLNKIVIIDTVMNLYPAMDRFVFPEIAKNVFKIAIHCVRNMGFAHTECHSRLGITLDKQIELSSDRDLFSCLPSSVVKGQNNDMSALRLHTSLSSKRDIRNIKETVIPSIVFTQVLLQDGTVMGTEYLMQFLSFVKTTIVQSTVDTSNMTLIEFLNYKLTVSSWKNIVSYLRSLYFEIRIPSQLKDTNVEDLKDGSVFLMKYRDGMCNFWNAKWARQMRGTIVRFANGQFVLDKLCLQRGAEVLTGYLKKHNIENTQDMNIDISKFDPRQQHVITTFMNGGNIDGAVSFKVDGSLLAVSLYDKNSEVATYWTNYIRTIGDEFNNVVLKKCLEMDLPFIAVISSQGTALIGNHMQDYTVTSLFNVETCDLTPAEIFAQRGNDFLNKIVGLYTGHNITLCFETVCKNRMTYLGNCHTELAVSYNKSFFRFLGLTDIDTGKYIPHYFIEETVHMTGLEQPNFWKIQHTSDVDKLMTSLGKIIYGTCSINQFYQENIPHNKFICETSLDYVDIEGFIFYFHDGESVDYSKIKTPEYYICHKFHLSNIGILTKLSLDSEMAKDTFPLCRTVGLFYNGLSENVATIAIRMCDAIQANLESLVKYLPVKAQSTFITQPLATKMKIIINTPSDVLWDLLRPILFNVYPDIGQETDQETDQDIRTEINSLIKQMLMQTAPWTDNMSNNIQTIIQCMNTNQCMNTKSNFLTALFNLLLSK